VRKSSAEADVAQMEIAMEWIQRLRDEKSTDKDVTEWLRWYEHDEHNRKVFDELQRFWNEAGALDSGPDGAARIAELERYENSPASKTTRGVLRSVFRRSSPTTGISSRLAMALAAALLIIRPAVFPEANISGDSPSTIPRAADSSSPVRHTQLPDGSTVDLTARTSLTVRYTASQRTLALKTGEAFFSVAPNHARPFVVNTEGVRIRAVGTQFNVRQESDRVVVTVVEGIVDISSMGSQVDGAADATAAGVTNLLRINAGNEVTWMVRSGERIVRATEPERVAAWREGRLDYVNESLAAVIADVNRYSNRRLLIRGADLGGMRYTGTVFLNAVDEWLRAMPSEFPIQVVQDSNQAFIIGPSNAGTGAAPR
jgi:transmembrane sensor